MRNGQGVLRDLKRQKCSQNGPSEQFIGLTYQVTVGPLDSFAGSLGNADAKVLPAKTTNFEAANSQPYRENCRRYLRHCQAEELREEFGSTGSRLIVNSMARGIYLIGSKREERVRGVQIVDRAGNSTTLRLKDYMSRKIRPGYTALPWQQDFMLQESDSKPTKQTADK